MNTNTNNCETKVVQCGSRNNSVLILIVLYILLAIILGSYWY